MNKVLYILITTFFFSISAFSAEKEEPVTITQQSIKKVGDQVELTMDIVVNKLNSKYKLTVTPVIYNTTEKKELEPVQIAGKYRYIADQREGIADEDVFVITRKTSHTIPYNVSIPYEDWMAEVSVDVKQFQEGCCSFDEPGRMTVAENKLLYYQPEPKFRLDPYDYEFTELEQYTLDNPFLHSMEDHNQRYDILVKDRDKGTSVVIFTVGSHKLDMNFQGNKDAMDAIAKAFKLIEDDPNAVLKHIMITGYASPEGSLAFNTALAQRRAETVKTYIQSILSSPRNELFELHNGREDWDGLRERVENSHMAEKSEILEIIDSYTMEQEIRKTKLKQLNGGAPYKYMLENFYPPLRSAGYVQVFYEIDRTATVATAVTDELGRTTWVDPESPANVNITRINEALKFIKESDFEQALTQLLQAKDDPKAFNFIGVCHMMMKNYDESGQWFRKALENNDPFAQENIDQLNMMRRVEF